MARLITAQRCNSYRARHVSNFDKTSMNPDGSEGQIAAFDTPPPMVCFVTFPDGALALAFHLGEISVRSPESNAPPLWTLYLQ